MCGRYVLTGSVSRYTEYFDAESIFDFEPSYNIAPSLVLPVIRRSPDGHRELLPAKWGLLPSWVKDPAEITHPRIQEALNGSATPRDVLETLLHVAEGYDGPFAPDDLLATPVGQG